LKIVAHMVCRNEADIITETVAEILRWVDILIVLDGASDDGTLEELQDLADRYLAYKTLQVVSRPDPGGQFNNGLRTELLKLTAPHVGPGDWVISVDADEIYDTYYDHNGNKITPITAILAAERVGANVVRCWVPQFWLTFEDLRRGALYEDESLSIQARRRWYSWGHMGTFIWKWNPLHFYPEDVSKRTPELPGRSWREWQRAGPLVPICKHYCIRSVKQGLERAEERLARGGRSQFGKYAGNWIVDEQIAGLHYLGENGVWCTERNHDTLYEYITRGMGG